MFINYRKGMNPVCRLCEQGEGKGKRFRDTNQQPVQMLERFQQCHFSSPCSDLFVSKVLLLMASVQCGVRRGVREQHQGQTAGV